MTSGFSAVPPVLPVEQAPAAAGEPAQPYGQATPHHYYAAQDPYRTGQPVTPRGLSIASMVCGITGLAMSFFLLGFLPALAGVILGHVAMKREPAGRGFSLTGIITGYCGLALSLVFGLLLLAVILIPFWLTGAVTGSDYYS